MKTSIVSAQIRKVAVAPKVSRTVRNNGSVRFTYRVDSIHDDHTLDSVVEHLKNAFPNAVEIDYVKSFRADPKTYKLIERYDLVLVF